MGSVSLLFATGRFTALVFLGLCRRGIVFLGLVSVPLMAAGDDKAVSADQNQKQIEHFEKHVRPLFAKHCFECHSAKTGPDNGGLVLETSAGILEGGSRGKLWEDNNAETGLLMEALNYEDPELQMPPAGKLTAQEIARISEWIKQGAALPKDREAKQISKPNIDYKQARKFWAFQPLSHPVPPDGNRADWPRRPLDRFILKRLETENLSPQPEADRRVLIRRLSFDLTGLPPTPEEVEAFVSDTSPDAYGKLVERLLSSPHYGERWARFWLDLARYTDTTASWLKSTGQAWLYRDWVVEAFNRNLPFDEFTRLQLASDLGEETSPQDLAALGFLGLSPTYWKELKLAPDVIKEVVAEEWDERIDTVSRTFLGLTIACARCHDHKFDPVSTRDYYALAGVFASTQLDDRPLLPDEQAAIVRQAKELASALEAKLKTIKDKNSAEAGAIKSELAQLKATPYFDAPWIHVVKEASISVVPDGDDATKLDYKDNRPLDLPIFRRGNPTNLGEVVPRGFPVIFSESDQPIAFEQGSGRRELADAMLSDAEALTARVFVNRIWLEHFGQGLVRTPSNFGQQGERPTHPELLDWLAAEFVARGWDIKWLHREIVHSATYRQGSGFDAKADRHDPENRLLWRMNRRRLSVEMWRDAMLVAAGSLDPALGGLAVPVDRPANHRRTIYATVSRHELAPMLRMFDFPEPTAHSPQRLPTTTPLQQLYVLNGPFIQQQADKLLGRLPEALTTAEKIDRCYQRLFARKASREEIAIGQAYLGVSEQTNHSTTIGPHRWQSYLHALLSLNEFLYVD